VGVLLLPEASSAQGLVLRADHRHVRTSVHAPHPPGLFDTLGLTNFPAVPFTDPSLTATSSIAYDRVNNWQARPTSAAVTQDAIITANLIHLSTTLCTDVGGDPYGFHFPPGAAGVATAEAESLFSIEFEIREPTRYDYTFDFSGFNTLRTAAFILQSDVHGQQTLSATGGSPRSGLLLPAIYTMDVRFFNRAQADQTGSTSASMTFVLVPEPSAGALGALGLAALLMIRRSRSAAGGT